MQLCLVALACVLCLRLLHYFVHDTVNSTPPYPGSGCVTRVNKRGEPMLVNLNMTAHMHSDNVFY